LKRQLSELEVSIIRKYET